MPPEFYDSIFGGSWDIEFRLQEMTDGTVQQVSVAWSELSGTYAPVPEPGTILLFGAGLAGLFYVRRTKTFNK